METLVGQKPGEPGERSYFPTIFPIELVECANVHSESSPAPKFTGTGAYQLRRKIIDPHSPAQLVVQIVADIFGHRC
jgi:hypothetical protein